MLRLDSSLVSNRGSRPPSLDVPGPVSEERASRPAVPFYLHLEGVPVRLQGRGATLREGLAQVGVFLREADLVRPSPETPLEAEIHIWVYRAKPVTIYADGGIISAYTLQPTLGEVLSELGIDLEGKDRVEPGLATPVHGPVTARVVRVVEEVLTEEEVVEYDVLRQASADMEIGTQALAQDGEDGLFKRTIRTIYEDGQEVERRLEREWLEKEPVPRIILYGTQIIWRQLDTPSGPIKYWRKLRMLATSYDASHGGKPVGHPAYGITYTGMRAGRGVVAVDPRVIPLYTRLYVPGYGLAVAGDTGGGVIGNLIDLGFEEGETGLWSTRWVDVYVLD